MNRVPNADQAARVYETFDYQTWPTHSFEKCTRCAKTCGLFIDCKFSGAGFGQNTH